MFISSYYFKGPRLSNGDDEGVYSPNIFLCETGISIIKEVDEEYISKNASLLNDLGGGDSVPYVAVLAGGEIQKFKDSVGSLP